MASWAETWPAAAPVSDRPRFLDGTLVVRLEPGGSGGAEAARANGVFRFSDADPAPTVRGMPTARAPRPCCGWTH